VGCLFAVKIEVCLTHLLGMWLEFLLQERDILYNCVVGHLFFLNACTCFILVFLLKIIGHYPSELVVMYI